jgi:DNA polymerase-1
MLVACDASQLEWRTGVELSGDQVGLAEIVEGQDTHSLNQDAFDLPSRLIAKIYLFRTIFRGSGYAFANDPAFSHVSNKPSFWDNVGEKFYKKYYGLNQWHHDLARLVTAGETIRGPTGREWQVDMVRDKRTGELKLPWTVFTNYPVQGTGADVMLIARLSFRRRLKAAGIPALLVSTVHDSIVVDVPRMYVDAVVALFYEVFDDLIENIKRCFGYTWKTPLACEVKVGMNLKDMVKVDRS